MSMRYMKKNAFENAVFFINIPRSREYSFNNSYKYKIHQYINNSVLKTVRKYEWFHERFNLPVCFKEGYGNEISTWFAIDNHSGIQ